MPVKYHCPKCSKRFVDWGAEKLGFKCPDCEDEELRRVGVSEDKPVRKPSLKRVVKQTVPTPPLAAPEPKEVEVDLEEGEEQGPEEELEEKKPLLATEDEEAEVPYSGEADLVANDGEDDEDPEMEEPEGLALGGDVPGTAEEPLEEVDETGQHWS